MGVGERGARGVGKEKKVAGKDPEKIASARLYTGPSGSRPCRNRLRNDGGGDPWVLTEEGGPFVALPWPLLRKAKRLRFALAMSASGITTCSIGTARWITSAAM